MKAILEGEPPGINIYFKCVVNEDTTSEKLIAEKTSPDANRDGGRGALYVTLRGISNNKSAILAHGRLTEIPVSLEGWDYSSVESFAINIRYIT